MTKRAAFLTICSLLVWSYFARPVYEFVWIAGQRIREKAIDQASKPSIAIPFDDVVALNTKNADELTHYLAKLRNRPEPELKALQTDNLSNHQLAAGTLRNQLRTSLQYPPPDLLTDSDFSALQSQTLGKDDLASYTLLTIPTFPGVHSVGVLIIPHKHEGRMPLIIAAHGRGGMPDRPANGKISIVNVTNRDLARGAIERGWAVYRPIYVFYGKDRPDNLRERLTVEAQEAGTTLPALEFARTIRALDYLTTRPEIDPNRIAMVGISYGGFNALYTTALDPRIKVAVVAAYFNDREEVLTNNEPDGFLDWRFSNSLRLFRDETMAALVCPRPLQVQAGTEDQLFPIAGARKAAALARFHYRQLDVESRFDFAEFVGRHDFNGELAWNFISRQWSEMP